jgi:signal peptidase II
LQATRGASAVTRSRIYLRLVTVAGLTVIADQVTKQLALDRLDRPVDLIEGLLTLRLTFNPGGAFGLFGGASGFFLVASILIIAIIVVWAGKLDEGRGVFPLGLILGGGIGNLVDRAVRDLGGRVVDFIDLHFWPVFNLADSAIVVGVLTILWTSFREQKPGDPSTQESAGSSIES